MRCRAQRAPRDAIPRFVEAGERPLQAADFQRALIGNEHIFEHNHAGGGGTQAELAFDFRRADIAFIAPLDDKPANRAIGDGCMAKHFRPNDK